MQEKRDYNKYEQGDIHWQWYSATPAYYDLVNESIAPFKDISPGRLVDIGCGDGLPLSLLYSFGHKCFGVDDSEVGIKMALEHGVSAEFFIEKAEKFATRGYSFDYLYSLNTIEHLDDPLCMVEMMKNVTNFGVIVTDIPHRKNDPFHVNDFVPEDIEKMFSDFNFERLPLSGELFFAYKIWRK